jgi:hypothetical protein
MVEKHRDVTFRGSKIAYPQHDRTGCKGQCVTQRKRVIDPASLVDGVSCGVHCLIQESLKPQNPRKYGARRYALVELKTNSLVGSLVGQNEIGQHVLDVSARAGLITQHVLHGAQQPPANQLIVSPLLLCCQRAKSLRHFESDLKVTDPEVKDV